MTTFTVARQTKPDNCCAVALHNVLRWLGADPPSLETLEQVLAANIGVGHSPPGHYETLAWWLRNGGLDVWLPAINYKEWTDEAVGALLADGWALVVSFRQDSGNQHAVAVVAPGFFVLDGLRSGAPVQMTAADLRRRRVGSPMALRLPQWG